MTGIPASECTYDQKVGYLKGRHVYCLDCPQGKEKTLPFPVAIYRSNIYPYRQTCRCCGKVLVHPQTAAWPELFPT